MRGTQAKRLRREAFNEAKENNVSDRLKVRAIYKRLKREFKYEK